MYAVSCHDLELALTWVAEHHRHEEGVHHNSPHVSCAYQPRHSGIMLTLLTQLYHPRTHDRRRPVLLHLLQRRRSG